MATRIVIAPTFYAETRGRGRNVLAAASSAVARDAQGIVPVRTGRLRSRISSRVLSSRLARVYARTRYAVFVELGTRYMSAQPYLRPALFQVRVGSWGIR